MSHDVFISYAAEDKLTADAVCASLEQRGLRCWIAPRDILPGQDYGEAIVAALGEVRAFVLVFSASANASEHVKNEVERVVNTGIPVIPFRTQDVPPEGSLALHLSRRHWLDALTPPLERHIETLAQAITLLLDVNIPAAEDAQSPQAGASPPAAPSTPPRPRPAFKLQPLLFGVAVLALLAVAFVAGRHSQPTAIPPSAVSAPAATEPASLPPSTSSPSAETTPATPTSGSGSATGNPNAPYKVTLDNGGVYYFDSLLSYFDVLQGPAKVSVESYDIRDLRFYWGEDAKKHKYHVGGYGYLVVTQKNGEKVEGNYPVGRDLRGDLNGHETTMDMDKVVRIEVRD